MHTGAKALLVLAGLTAGCSHHAQPRLAANWPVRQSPAVTRSAPPGGSVWQLRAGLNVAALLCKGRGRVSVVGDYARMLSHHRGLLAAAYSAEQVRYGGGFDRHETRLYNRFSNQRDPVRFCRIAAGVARQAVSMNSPALAQRASRLVSALG